MYLFIPDIGERLRVLANTKLFVPFYWPSNGHKSVLEPLLGIKPPSWGDWLKLVETNGWVTTQIAHWHMVEVEIPEGTILTVKSSYYRVNNKGGNNFTFLVELPFMPGKKFTMFLVLKEASKLPVEVL